MIYLYIKRHSKTNLKYFGMTKKSDPFKYPGSGAYWKKHFKKHGKQYIQTLDIFGFDNQEDATEFALNFSKQYNIVESKEWANQKEEDATAYGGKHSENTKALISQKAKERIPHKNSIKTLQTIWIDRKRSDEDKINKSNYAKSRIWIVNREGVVKHCRDYNDPRLLSKEFTLGRVWRD